jgi:hypothetical protein
VHTNLPHSVNLVDYSMAHCDGNGAVISGAPCTAWRRACWRVGVGLPDPLDLSFAGLGPAGRREHDGGWLNRQRPGIWVVKTSNGADTRAGRGRISPACPSLLSADAPVPQQVQGVGVHRATQSRFFTASAEAVELAEGSRGAVWSVGWGRGPQNGCCTRF